METTELDRLKCASTFNLDDPKQLKQAAPYTQMQSILEWTIELNMLNFMSSIRLCKYLIISSV